VRDPIGKLGWPKEKGRDGERTPMQWDTSNNAGFSNATPWLPVPDSYKTHNVSSESQDPSSVLSFYRKVLKLRHTSHALLDGDYQPLNQNDSNVLSYLRKYKNEAVLVVLNMSNSEQKVSFDASAVGGEKTSTLLATSNGQNGNTSVSSITLEPFG